MPERIVHDEGKLYEYSLPVSKIPAEADRAWEPWLSAYVGRSVHECHEILGRRFRACSPALMNLATRVLEHIPHSLFVYRGTPSLCLQSKQPEKLSISVPPEMDHELVQRGLMPYRLENHRLLLEFFELFGGIADQTPDRAANIAGERRSGQVVIEPAATDFEAGLECLTESEIRERRKHFARWMDGIHVLHGDDGNYWHLGTDGSVCWHECGDSEIGGVFDSLADLINAFVEASTAERLFEGLYGVLPGMRKPERD
jgi:hypothetical protein